MLPICFIREIRNKGIPEHCKEIIKWIFRNTEGESPYKQFVKEIYRLCPYKTFDQVKERSTRFLRRLFSGGI